ncbi:flavodoxin family protein [Aspergillus candidus]|uniref:Flavone synthase cfoJ n=1 Tax=Aspergillus candidus TaxID=41067 RepID=CFOJ_ASPCN|nr:flavo protein [Aspergillus candidus]A0A2I2F2M7.1 RecName: Full=Flavone synthase cfoJ; Short=FNS cfoJ; AltName: Full=Chlorflavonin biosynthesis cluster protein J; AltName: Full=FMN-dependent oxidoreductase cfoJ [Aspergillus candidus]PLB34859.1 flavo protein [Aspergillus candidus]
MRFLGISGGSAGGNTEQALLAALRAAQTAAKTPATISLVRLKELSIGSGALDGHLPLPVVGKSNSTGPVSDDRPFILDQIMEADAIILGAPCITRTIPWEVKCFQDSTLGPFQDVTMAQKLVDAGKGHLVDQRIFKPRVLALVTLGGAFTTEWAPFTLPLLHQVFFPLGTQIVDQMQVFGTGVPDSFLLNSEAMVRAEELGRNLAQQAQATTEGEATYVGPRGMCPICHLSMFNFVGRDAVECATCGAKGRMGVGDDGHVEFVTDSEGESFSVLRRSGLKKHLQDLEQGLQAEGASTKVLDIKNELLKLGQSWVVAPPSRGGR